MQAVVPDMQLQGPTTRLRSAPLPLQGVCANPPCIVSEYCTRGSLTDVLHQARISRDPAAALSWARRLSIAAEAAAGMAYLHSRTAPVVHRDLKSPNILIDAGGCWGWGWQ